MIYFYNSNDDCGMPDACTTDARVRIVAQQERTEEQAENTVLGNSDAPQCVMWGEEKEETRSSEWYEAANNDTFNPILNSAKPGFHRHPGRFLSH